MIPSTLAALSGERELPPLYDAEVALMEAAGLTEPAQLLAGHIRRALGRASGASPQREQPISNAGRNELPARTTG